MIFPLTTPQLFALLVLAAIAAFLAELLIRNAPPLGFMGGLFLGLLGVWIFANITWLDVAIEPRLEDIPVVRALLGGILLVALFCYMRKRQNA
jgi:uncharacterized membrane protein YeaQ/YmgE (transglycosylase-associated protein family)